MIKFQHSVFALPFALAAMIVAGGGLPSLWVALWIVAACVFARSAAMTFNRLVDLKFDRLNPRTAGRALVTGEVNPSFAWLFLALNVAGFVVSSALLNRLCLYLSPLALVILLGYSLVKRFSVYTHFVLGLALGVAPMGAWLAVTGRLPGVEKAALLSMAVVMWTAGFDIIYACQDKDIDRRLGLCSIPASLGIKRALLFSALLHGFAIVALLGFWLAAGLGTAGLVAILIMAALLALEHSLVGAEDLSKVNTAFFTINGVVSFVFLSGVILDLIITYTKG